MSPATPQSKAAVSQRYEEALEKYYNLSFNTTVTFSWVLSYYRKHSGKTDPKYNYLKEPEFADLAEKKFKEHWKSKARALFTLQDLDYLIMYHNSKLRQKLIKMEQPIFEPSAIVNLFDSIPVNVSQAPAGDSTKTLPSTAPAEPVKR